MPSPCSPHPPQSPPQYLVEKQNTVDTRFVCGMGEGLCMRVAFVHDYRLWCILTYRPQSAS